jgi:hypothetical protein
MTGPSASIRQENEYAGLPGSSKRAAKRSILYKFAALLEQCAPARGKMRQPSTLSLTAVRRLYLAP